MIGKNGGRIIFDAIVIGGGLAGLTSATLLSKAGLKVLLLEKNRRVGGYAVSYTVKGHRFDVAIQAVGGCEEGGIVRSVLKELNCEHRISFLPCEPARVYYFRNSSTPWIQAGSWQRVAESLRSLFPDYSNEIEECHRVWSGILKELSDISSVENGMRAFTFSRSYPFLYRYGGYTVRDFLQELEIPDGLQSLLSARAGYCMLEPQRLSLIGFACTEMTYSQGAWLVEGGVGQLGKTLANVFTEMGGLIQYRSPVTTISTDNGRIKGVRTLQGREFLSRLVIVASAVRPALHEWLDRPELLPDRYLRRLGGMEPTGSYYIAFYGVATDAVQGLFPNMEVRCGAKSLLNNWFPDTFYMLIPSLVDKNAAPEGSHCLCLSLPCPPGLRMSRKERLICKNFIQHMAEDRFPQIRGKLKFFFDLCPQNLAAISGNPQGSAYGWAQTPEQAGVKRLNIKTPIPGLFLTGHWTMPGGGIAGVITSGRLCANAALVT